MPPASQVPHPHLAGRVPGLHVGRGHLPGLGLGHLSAPGTLALLSDWDEVTRPCRGSKSSWMPGPGAMAVALGSHAGAAAEELRESAGLGQDPQGCGDKRAGGQADRRARKSGGGPCAAGSLWSAGPWGWGQGGQPSVAGGWVSPQDCCLVASGELPHSEGLASGSGFSARWLANVEPTSVRGPDEGQEVAFHLGQLAFCSGKGRQGRGPGTHEARGRPCSGALAALWPQQWGRGLPENMMSHQHPPVTLGRSHPIIWWAVIAGVFSDHFCAR